MGENIDFGPNDAMGVIISLILDDGEEERPHRKTIFQPEHRKVGIACGPHKTEFQMCVMDFAFDFLPLNTVKENNQNNKNNERIVICKFGGEDKELLNNQQIGSNAVNNNDIHNSNNQGSNNEIDKLIFQTTNIINNKKVISKKVEIVTKITYTYEDGSTKVVTQNESHEFKG